MFDSNVWDEFDDNNLALLQLEDLVSAGTVKVLTTSIQEQENSKTAKSLEFKHYKLLLKTQTIDSEGFIVEFARLDLDKFGLEKSRWVVSGGSHNRDEVIAQTAVMNNAWLVTQEKKRLRQLAIRNQLPVYNLLELMEELSKTRPLGVTRPQNLP
jgi:hypothetical protein